MAARKVRIKGFTRKDGVKVKGHTRTVHTRKRSSRLGSKEHLAFLSKGIKSLGRRKRKGKGTMSKLAAYTRNKRRYQRTNRKRRAKRAA